jgi:prepilin-type N-terminal cleavage/methylation domain-containing protein
MTRLYNNSKRGFTLVETMCTVAIIVTLLAITTVGITDHLDRAHSTANVVLTSRKNLDAIDGEAFSNEGHSVGIGNTAPANTPSAPATSSDSEAPKASGGSSGIIASTNEISSDIAEAAGAEAVAEPDPEMSEEEAARQAMIDDVASNISSFASAHGVTYLPGTEDLPNILATAEVSAQELYEDKGFTDPRYFMYCPATGEIKLSNGDGKKMTCNDGQNFIKAVLNEDAARNINGTTEGNTANLRTQIDSNYLNNSSKYIYIGVNKNSDGTYQVVPNVCVDVNGNFNSIITWTFDNGSRWTIDQSTLDASTMKNSQGQTVKNWNGYVAFVTNASGSMLDLSRINTSSYTGRSSNSTENSQWCRDVQALRTAS